MKPGQCQSQEETPKSETEDRFFCLRPMLDIAQQLTGPSYVTPAWAGVQLPVYQP